jgi:hypothetical protein
MKHRGVRNWPPVWTKASLDNKAVQGEVGILRSVHFSNYDESHSFLLIIEHESAYYVGTVLFDDITFHRQMIDLLQRHIGRSIKEIGDLDLSYTL